MKKTLLTVLLFIFSSVLYAQTDVTQFLGIPVDGSKSEMIQKLKAKGYTSTPFDKDILTGQFNGTDVEIHIVTNNNKVCRIMVCDEKPSDERSIQIRFNRLCEQFKNNSKYLSLENQLIPDDEDISYEIIVHKKRYEAVFYQKPQMDTITIVNEMRPILLSKYTEEQLENATDEVSSEILKMSIEYVIEKSSKKPVWFMISNHLRGYFITMFYDNEYNRANGEDL